MRTCVRLAHASLHSGVPRICTRSLVALSLLPPLSRLPRTQVQKYFSFEVEVEDTVGKLYRLDIGNAHTVVRLRLDSANLPLALTSGWNKLSLDLADLTKTCFNATFKQAHRVKILASCRLRR